MSKLQSILKHTALLIILGLLIVPGLHATTMVKKIVLFEENVTPQEINTYIKSWKANGAVLIDHVPFINGVIMSVPEYAAYDSLSSASEVAYVADDQAIELQPMELEPLVLDKMDTSQMSVTELFADGAADGGAGDSEPIRLITPLEDDPLTGDRLPWGLVHLYEIPYSPYLLTTPVKADAIPSVVTYARSWQNINGVKIAIFDTGVDFNHPKINGLIESGLNLVDENAALPEDDNGHGTHVAATIVGEDLGLAMGSQLYPVKVLDQNAGGEVSTLIRAFQWAIDNEMDVINMSLAFRDDNPAVRLAVKKVYERGIIMIAAVGNHSNWDGGAADGGAADGGAADGGAADGGAADGDGSDDGSYPVMYPAAYPEVIAIGAHDAFGKLAEFSNTGPEMDLTAPGTNVVSGNLTEISLYGLGNGTSMATPHVTGTVALMLALDEDHEMSPEEVKEILMDTTIDGRLNLVDALNEVNGKIQYTESIYAPEKIYIDYTYNTVSIRSIAY